MEQSYKKTFDAVSLSPVSREHIRSELSSRFAENQKEDKVIKINSRKRLITVLLAAVISISLLTAVSFAYGPKIIHMLGGSYIEIGSGKNSDGDDYVSITITGGNNPAEVRDGRVFITLDGMETDITSYCTETTFFMYEKTDSSGNRHVLIIGGTPDNLGWADFVFKENGQHLGSSSVYYAREYDDKYIAGTIEGIIPEDYFERHHYGTPIWLIRAYAEVFP